MKVVINATTTRPSGTLTSLLGYLRAWTRDGCPFDVTVLASVPGSIELLEQAKFNCKIEPVLVGQSMLVRQLWCSTRLGGWLRRQRADVLVAGTHYVSGRIPIPQVVHHHNLWRFITPDLGIEPRNSLAERARDWSSLKGLRYAGGNVFVSNFIQRQAEKFDATRTETFRVMPNGVDDDLVEAARRAGVPDSDRAPAPTLMSVQSANVQKDNETLIRTLAALVKMAPQVPWKLQVAGSAGRAGWVPYQNLARELGVFDRIEWLGFLSPTQLRSAEEQALCLVATSRFESSGLPLIEAMSARCPVVSTNIPAFEEYGGGAAELAPAGDHHAFAAAVLRIHDNPSHRAELIQKGVERAWYYRWSAWAPVMTQAIQQAAGFRVTA